MKRKICVITGTRADYGILYPVMRAIQSSAQLQLYVVVTCMHLMPEFGYTIREIERDGFPLYAKIDISYQEDSGRAIAFALGRELSALAKTFARLKPDLVMVLGDRGEMLIAAIAANYLNIPVVHLHGGEISGHVDGILRHAITKLAHLHFVATGQAKARVLKLGEERWRVHRVGAPALDRLKQEKLPGKKELVKKYHLAANESIVLLAQHPISTESDKAAWQIGQTLAALASLKLQTVVIYPNADAGGRRMIKVIKRNEQNPCFQGYQSLPHKDYLGLLKIAAVLVGNSSSGLIEAPSFGLPAVNIGSRQSGRERGINVIDVPVAKNAIRRAIKKALTDKKYLAAVKRQKNHYGDGQASRRIVRVLANVPLNKRLLEKRLIDQWK